MRRRTGLLLLLVAVAAAGCGAGADSAQRVALADLNVPAPRLSPSPPSQSVSCRNPTASLRPPETLPAPGAMPAGSAMAAIARRGYLIAGVDQNTLLFAYFNPLDGQIEGFEIDLLRQLAQAILGNPNAIRFKAVTTSERLQAVRSGSVDVVADATTITCERKQLVAFSTVYYNASQRILVPVDSRARSAADLSGERVCATAGSTSLQTLTRLYPHAVPYPVAQRTDCLVALQQGVVSAVTSDDAILLGFAAQDPLTKLVGPPFAAEPYGMVISRAHPELVRFVNGVLARMRADGRWRADYIHWLARFSSTVPAPPSPQYEG
jgi:polar amino acid transport system substrate-binding protein